MEQLAYFRRFVRSCWSVIGRRDVLRSQNNYRDPNYDGAVGDIEGRPVITPPVGIKEIDDMPVSHSVQNISECSPENGRQAYLRER